MSISKLNTLLQFLAYPPAFCFAIENIWVTALMISYHTPNLSDAFIWIIPNILSILLRPYLIALVHLSSRQEQSQLDFLSFFTLLSAIGCFLVAVSSSVTYFGARIVVATLGWTLMDVGLEMGVFFGGKLREKLERGGYAQNGKVQELGEIIGSVIGYIVSYCICIQLSGKSMRKFQNCAAFAYLVCTVVLLLYWLCLNLAHSTSFAHLFPSLRFLTPSFQIGYYLPGLYEIKSVDNAHRSDLYLYFGYLWAVDTLLIYGSMWMVYVELPTIKESAAFNSGMGSGSILLLTYTIASYIPTFFSLPTPTLKQFQTLLIAVFLLSMLCFMSLSCHLLYLLSILTGLCTHLYNWHLEEVMGCRNSIFNTCKELVERIEKIVILCTMPYLVMICLDRDDVEDCLGWSCAVGVAMLGLTNLGSRKTQATHKRVDKVE